MINLDFELRKIYDGAGSPNRAHKEIGKSVLDRLYSNNSIDDAKYNQLLNLFPNDMRTPPKPAFKLKASNIVLSGLESLPPREFVLKRFNWERGMLVTVCGTGCSGKSMFVQYLAVCLSANKPIFGKYLRENNGGENWRILHIDMEQAETLTRRRYERIAAGLGVKEIDVDRLKLPFKLDDPKFSKEEIEKELVETFKQYNVVVIDSLRQSVLCDENNSQIADTLHMLRGVAEKSKALTLLIHHMGKSNGGSKQSGRGSSAIYDSVDAQLDMDAKDGVIEIKCSKNRDAIYWKGIRYTMDDAGEFVPEQNTTKELVFTLLSDDVQVNEDDRQLKIVQFVNENKVANQKELFDLVKGGKEAFDELVKQMLQQKLLVESRGPKNARLFHLGEHAENYLFCKA